MRKRGYKVPPLSGQKIYEISQSWRDTFNLGNNKYVPIMPLLEVLHRYDIVQLECCDDSEIASRGEGFYDPTDRKILVSDSVYCDACANQGRARFTIAHELGHFFLKHTVVFGRNDDPHWKAYMDSEWQADTFAGYFLAPPKLICLQSTVDQIAADFGLSYQAAEIALRNAKKARQNA